MPAIYGEACVQVQAQSRAAFGFKIIVNRRRMELVESMAQQQRQRFLRIPLPAVAGFKHREIAEFLRLPLATVLSKYSRASKKLRKILEKEGL